MWHKAGKADMNSVNDALQKAVVALRKGEAVIFPTDTVYGLGISLKAHQSPDILYRLKERERGKPIAWLVGSTDDLCRYGENVSQYAKNLAQTYWPGPLTLIVRASSRVPQTFCSPQKTIGLRMPDNAFVLDVIAKLGCPLATTSANISGSTSTGLYKALDPALLERVSVVVSDNKDEHKSGLASTVIDCTQESPRIIRQGALVIHIEK